MKKLRLDLDDLQVESFDPRPASLAPRGTVRGNDDSTVFTATTVTVVTVYYTENVWETCWNDCATIEEDMTCMRSCVEGGYNDCGYEEEAH